MNLREAAEQALEDLENEIFSGDWCECDYKVHHHDCSLGQIITALRAALAEPETEPVAWMESPYGAIRANPLYKIAAPQSVEWSIPLYTALAEPDEIVRQHEDGTVTVKRSSGWRQCAVGQKATQYCGLLEQAVKAEREAIWNFIFEYAGRHDLSDSDQSLLKYIADAIRARGEIS